MNEQAREEQTEVNQDKLWNSNRQLGSSQESALASFSSQTAPAYWTASAANKKKQFLYPQTENLN